MSQNVNVRGTNQLFTFFQLQPVKDLLKPDEKLIWLQHTTTVKESVETLAKHNISSAPVVDVVKQRVLGMVDMMDIAAYLCVVFPKKNPGKEDLAYNSPVSEVVNASGKNPYVPLCVDNPATSAIQILANRIHRVPVVNKKGVVMGTLSQSSIVKVIYNNLDNEKFKPIISRKVKDLKQLKLVTALPKDWNVLVAVSIMFLKNISALPVTDTDGKLCGNFSVLDLKGITTTSDFKLTMEEFLKKYSPKSLQVAGYPDDLTFEEAVKELVKNKSTGGLVHRLWIVNKDQKPVGVVSMTDIMQIIQSTM